ncbi:dnaJ homolog subfamily C member 4 [Neopsephotus bourkii]|uniref:dnaJ homolog subfamily C member 4 n=1 Tax=Neopsephotus bourkii TaxID=309878 RepID=UPI002AA54678|nr:dnaJ homolog subfamily C member 4 [Neopsephotus bourkii]
MGPWAAPPRLLPRTGPGLCTRAGPRDPYSVLGVRPEASPAEIRAAFLERCKEVHPDGDPSDPSRHERFLLLAEAYGALTRPRAPPEAPPGAPPGAPPRPKAGAKGAGAPPHSKPPPRTDPNRRYWEQFCPPRRPRGPPWRVLGLCLLVATVGGLAHALAYRYVTGAHTAFLNERDRVLTAVYEQARSRAGSHEEVLRRLRASRQRGRGEV